MLSWVDSPSRIFARSPMAISPHFGDQQSVVVYNCMTDPVVGSPRNQRDSVEFGHGKQERMQWACRPAFPGRPTSRLTGRCPVGRRDGSDRAIAHDLWEPMV